MAGDEYIWVKDKNRSTRQIRIKRSEFNEEKHEMLTEEESKPKRPIDYSDPTSFPGIVVNITKFSTPSKSATYKGKLDSGAAKEMMDVGIEKAKPRLLQTKKETGRGPIGMAPVLYKKNK